jgi:O-antigen/teichoic acid export membrane protein
MTAPPPRQQDQARRSIIETLRQSIRLRQVMSSRLTRHSAINVGGSMVPLFVAMPCLAILPRHLQMETFSLLLLAWALVGYAGILDLGLTRAVTLLISREAQDATAQREILSTSFFVASASGILGAIVLWFGIGWFLDVILKTSSGQRDDAIHGFRLIALSVPMLLPYLIFQGYWDGREQFVESNLQRVVGGSMPIVAATLAVLIKPDFTAAAAGMLIGRVLTLLFSLSRGGIWREINPANVRRSRLRLLLGFGGWVTVSSGVGPLMGYLDRYILAYARGAAIVAFYAAPSELILKLLVVPAAVTRSLYPKLAASRLTGNEQRDMRNAYALIIAVCFPIAAGLALLAPYILQIWLGQAYALNSTNVVRLLAAGFLFAALAQVPFTQLHAKGRPELVAAVHVVEVVIFVPAAYLAAAWYGPVGCAGAWAARNLIDLLIFYGIGRRASWR